jgi:asparagine synthase (glutamine-hydrolysing)
MCGIAGIFLTSTHRTADSLGAQATRMADALRLRGPDAGGVWVDAAQGIALGHRRLSIIDLSPDGAQPMVSASGRYVVSYNGEIYNYQQLRARLDYPWRGHSDTQVLLAAVEAWGIEKALQEMNGMFAFALWDVQEKTLTLARDRMGEKPLYYGKVGEAFAFASELKALRKVEGWQPTIDRAALAMLMRTSYIPAPHSIYEGIYKLEPAHYVTLSAGMMDAQPKPYWSFKAMARNQYHQRQTLAEPDAVEALDARMRHAVSQRMMADVPLGAFLSGGVDSSTIAALMQAQSPHAVQTFTIGFHEQGFDEAPYAKAVAAHLGTQHHELYVTPREAAAVIPNLPHIYDEPFADSSQIPTFLVAQFARRHVTVALSGDGGDELFGGYNRYLRGPSLWRAISALPLPLRRAVSKALLLAHHMLARQVTGTSHMQRLVRKLGNYYEKIGTVSAQEFYRGLCSVHNHPETLVLGTKPEILADTQMGLPFAEWMMLQDALTYFPGDILTKVDRAAMAVSLETRTPFTDPEVMALAWQLPLAMKIRDGQGKWLLRQVLDRYVPTSLIERPKAGFAVPIGAWLRGDLKPWAEALLAPERLAREGYLNPQAVGELWRIHQSRARDCEHALWNVLMFQSWLDSQSVNE